MRLGRFGAVLMFGMTGLIGCGVSTDSLNRLAAAGEIHREAPVVAHAAIQIQASPERVWAVLVDAPAWPNWFDSARGLTAPGPLAAGMRFDWLAGGKTMSHSQVQMFEPARRLSWTGTALTSKTIHVWKLEAANGGTEVTLDESMDGLLTRRPHASKNLTRADQDWLEALKKAVEGTSGKEKTKATADTLPE